MARFCLQALGLVAALLLAASASPAHAFCVYNDGGEDVTFLAWPISAHTFKQVVNPGGNACCNWANPTCFAKSEGDDSDDPLAQCADVVFYITPRSLDTNAITQKFIEKEVESALAPLVAVLGVAGSLIPGVGEVVGAAAAFGAAGLDLAAESTDTGIDFEASDQWVHAINGGTVTWHDPSTIDVTTATGC